MYAFHILTQQAADDGQNDKKKKCTFHNRKVLVKLRLTFSTFGIAQASLALLLLTENVKQLSYRVQR